MSKYLFIALLIGSLAFRIEAFQPVGYTSDTSVILSDNVPPQNWFNTPKEQEVAAALHRIAGRLGSEKDVKRRHFAENQIALGLARLGREKEARQLAQSGDIQKQISYLLAVHAILNERQSIAIDLLPRMSEPQRIKVKQLLGRSFYLWRNDRESAIKWLRSAADSLSVNPPPVQESDFLKIQIGANLAQLGAIKEAQTLFQELDGKYERREWQVENGYFNSVALFDYRLKNGLDSDAVAMLNINPALIPIAIQRFFELKKSERALELLNRCTSLQAFKMLDNMNRDTPKAWQNREAFDAMRMFWGQLTQSQQNNLINAVGMTISTARFESVRNAYIFIAHNFQGEVAQVAARMLKETILYDGELQKQVEPQTLQNWRDEIVKKAELKARGIGQNSIEVMDYEVSGKYEWLSVYEVAMEAKNWQKARFALTKSHQIAENNKDFDSIDDLLTRYNAWHRLGDKKRANQNLLQVKKKIEKYEDPYSADVFDGSTTFLLYPEIIRELLYTKPPHDLRVADRYAGSAMARDNEKTAISQWVLKIPDVSTRAVIIAARARQLWPLESVQIQLN